MRLQTKEDLWKEMYLQGMQDMLAGSLDPSIEDESSHEIRKKTKKLLDLRTK